MPGPRPKRRARCGGTSILSAALYPLALIALGYVGLLATFVAVGMAVRELAEGGLLASAARMAVAAAVFAAWLYAWKAVALRLRRRWARAAGT